MNSNSPLLEMLHVSRDYQGRLGVEDILFRMETGTITALVGPNGAGKSTLLKLVTGMLKATSGDIHVWGRPAFPPAAHSASRIAWVLEGHAPPSWVRISDLIRLRREAVPQFNLELAQKLITDRSIGLQYCWYQLSKGLKRWVLLVLALSSQADLLVLDEPVDGLDPEGRAEFYRLLRQDCNARQSSVLVATHVLSDVERVADEIAVMYAGRLVLQAPLEQLREEVSEVEIQGLLVPEKLPEAVQVLSARRLKDSTVICMRFLDPQLAERPLHGEIMRRKLNLQETYLAISKATRDKSSELVLPVA